MNMFANKNSAGKPNAKKPTIRRETVQIAVKPAPSAAQAPSHARSRDANRFKLSDRAGSKSQSSPTQRLKPPKTVEKRALAPSRGVKRPSADPMFSSDDEDSSDFGASDSDASRKRIKSSVSSVDSVSGLRRSVVSQLAFAGASESLAFIHGADSTSNEHATKYRNPWEADDFTTVELQYPSKSPRERFQLKWPKNEADDYKPMEDVIETVKHIALYYFPGDLSAKYTDDGNGFSRRFNRAWQHQSIPEFTQVVEEFNSVLSSLVEDGTVQRELALQTGLHLDWVKRILEQIYARTVSPKVESLRAYQNGSDNVYGELFPRFISDIFKRTQLNHKQVFIDLGSGVGNVVLQAALEVGCESWGIEMMKNPCDLADMQAAEFASRTRLWGLDVGQVRLLRGDMTKHAEVPAILQRADVVLVNNQAFTPELNDDLCNMFLDLKPGAQVVSLKPFVPEGHKMAMRNIDSVANTFVQRKFEYFSDSVSWSYYGNANWYIATKDTRPLNAFRKKNGLG